MNNIIISNGNIFLPENINGFSPSGDEIRVNLNGTYIWIPFKLIVQLYEGFKSHFENGLKRNDFEEYVNNLFEIKVERK